MKRACETSNGILPPRPHRPLSLAFAEDSLLTRISLLASRPILKLPATHRRHSRTLASRIFASLESFSALEKKNRTRTQNSPTPQERKTASRVLRVLSQ